MDLLDLALLHNIPLVPNVPTGYSFYLLKIKNMLASKFKDLCQTNRIHAKTA